MQFVEVLAASELVLKLYTINNRPVGLIKLITGFVKIFLEKGQVIKIKGDKLC